MSRDVSPVRALVRFDASLAGGRGIGISSLGGVESDPLDDARARGVSANLRYPAARLSNPPVARLAPLVSAGRLCYY
jgi:hypothetical protein